MLEMGERSTRIYLPDHYRYAENDESLVPLSLLPQWVEQALPRGEQAVWLSARDENGERVISLFRRVMQRSDFLQAAHDISIHSPHTGRDDPATASSASRSNFNPLSPHGERRSDAAWIQAPRRSFNPLSPHGERPFHCM